MSPENLPNARGDQSPPPPLAPPTSPPDPRPRSTSTPSPRRARRISVAVNGDPHFLPFVYAFSSDRIRTFQSLLADLTRMLGSKAVLPLGVRVLFSRHGRRVTSLDEIQDGHAYFASSVNRFRGDGKAKAGRGKVVSERGSPLHGSCVRIGGRGEAIRSSGSGMGGSSRSRFVLIIRNGVGRPRRVIRCLLNGSAASLHQVLCELTGVVKLDTGAVRSLYRLDGEKVTRLEELLARGRDVFFAVGHEGRTALDVRLSRVEEGILAAQEASIPARRRLRSKSRASQPSGMPIGDGRVVRTISHTLTNPSQTILDRTTSDRPTSDRPTSNRPTSDWTTSDWGTSDRGTSDTA